MICTTFQWGEELEWPWGCKGTPFRHPAELRCVVVRRRRHGAKGVKREKERRPNNVSRPPTDQRKGFLAEMPIYRREDNVAQKNYGATIDDDDLAMQPQSKDCCCSPSFVSRRRLTLGKWLCLQSRNSLYASGVIKMMKRVVNGKGEAAPE